VIPLLDEGPHVYGGGARERVLLLATKRHEEKRGSEETFAPSTGAMI